MELSWGYVPRINIYPYISVIIWCICSPREGKSHLLHYMSSHIGLEHLKLEQTVENVLMATTLKK